MHTNVMGHMYFMAKTEYKLFNNMLLNFNGKMEEA
jgi:hypothetical protein